MVTNLLLKRTFTSGWLEWSDQKEGFKFDVWGLKLGEMGTSDSEESFDFTTERLSESGVPMSFFES